MNLDGYLTTSQTARRLGVSQELVRIWAKRGRLPALVTPYGKLYPTEAVERLAAERRERAARG